METIESLSDDKKWKGGWYQNIILPSGKETKASLGDSKKWEIIEPYLRGSKTFLDIGCNAGQYLVKAGEHFDKIYGIEKSEYFIRQCYFVLEQFNMKAGLFNVDAIGFDFKNLPHIDTTLMANTLYWVVYSDENGYIDNSDKKLHTFLGELSEKTTHLILIGAEDIDRVGGSLLKTEPVIADFFHIKDTKVVKTKDRTLNLIFAKSKKANIQDLKKALAKRTDGGSSKQFMKMFGRLVEDYIAYKDWVKSMIKKNGDYQGYNSDEQLMQGFIQYIHLIEDIRRSGVKEPILVHEDDFGTEIDGMHRLIIADKLGKKTICTK